MANILVVEDDPAVAMGLVELLKAEHHEVTHCTSGEDALLAADNHLPDIVLLDIMLPGMNGYDVCRRLRESHYIHPVIMLSARSQPMDRVVGLEVGADDYVTKPFNGRELIARISAHLRGVERQQRSRPKPGERRHLLAVMFTDIADYSHIMHVDEERGVRLLHTHNALMRRIIEENAGTVVEIIGDAFLARFESAVDAVHAAVRALAALNAHNTEHVPDDHIHVRIGIHLGDVLDYGDNLKGDTVNIAARIQQLAQPDTLYISDDVYNVITRKIKCDFEDLGEQMLKNISNPLRVWKVRKS